MPAGRDALWDELGLSSQFRAAEVAGVTRHELLEARSRFQFECTGKLSETERVLYLLAKAAYEGLKPIPCTQYKYCQPCPNGVGVPRDFELYNDTVIHGLQEKTQRTYPLFFPAAQHADHCRRCGECEPKCPQHIPIMEWLLQVEGRLGPPVSGRVEGLLTAHRLLRGEAT
jgi:predicted aldo/keto reductase-like oxidoreductase